MIEPEDMKRFERHVKTMIRKAADDTAAFRQIRDLLAQAEALMSDAYLDLNAQGYSAQEVANELGQSRQAVRQRYTGDAARAKAHAAKVAMGGELD